MPWFRCSLRGENFPLTRDGKSGPWGFFATRWVEAQDAAAAELKAVDMIRRDKTFADMPHTTTPMIYLEEIGELARKPEEARARAARFS